MVNPPLPEYVKASHRSTISLHAVLTCARNLTRSQFSLPNEQNRKLNQTQTAKLQKSLKKYVIEVREDSPAGIRNL